MSDDRFHIRPTDVQARRDLGYAGQSYHGSTTEDRDAINAAPTVAHRVRLTFAPLAGSETFGWTITKDGESYDFSFAAAAGDDTAAEVGAAAKVALDLDVIHSSIVEVVDNLDGTIDLISYASGEDSQFTLASLVGHTSQSTVNTGADAAEIPFGRALVSVAATDAAGAFTSLQQRNTMDEFCALPSSTTLPAFARRFVFSGSYTNDEQVFAEGSYELDGVRYVMFAGASDGAALDGMGAALATALNAFYGSILTATYTAASNTLDVVSDIPGLRFSMVVRPNSSASSLVVTTTTPAGSDSDLGERFLGIAKYTHDTHSTTLGQYATAYLPGEGVKILARGAAVVAVSGGTPTRGGTVYVGTSAGEEGKFYATSGSGRCQLPRRRALWRGYRGSVGVIDLF